MQRAASTLLARLGALTLLAALQACNAFAIGMGQRIEEFDDQTYRDPVVTNAEWDPATGTLHMPSLQTSLLGTSNTPGEAYGVALNDSLAFVADFGSGLRIIGVKNPAAPVALGSFDTPGTAFAVAVVGTIAYVADGAAGLQIINVANPLAPALLGTFNTPGSAQGVAVVGTLAYVADGASGLLIIDVANPAIPLLQGTFNSPGSAVGVAVAGGRAYVADLGSGLHIVNVSPPTTPGLLGTYDTPGNAQAVAIAGNRAYVADDAAGLEIVSVANPASPVLLGALDTPGNAVAVAVWGNTAFVADLAAGVQMIDVDDPAAPALISTYDTPNVARGLAVLGAKTYVADGTTGLQIHRSGSYGPNLIGSLDTPGNAFDVAVAGNFAYVADGLSGLLIVDVSDPANAFAVGSLALPDYAIGVAVVGTTAYVADNLAGLKIINVSNPASPALLGTYDTSGEAVNVVVVGGVAYVADGPAGLRMVNVSNPVAPSLMGTYDTPGYANDVVVSGTRAYVADYGAGLAIVNVSNPAAPSLVGSVDTPGLAAAVAIAGTVVYIADNFSGLQIIDVSVGSSPVIVASATPGGSITSVATWGSLLAVCGGPLRVVDAINLASVSVLGHTWLGGGSVTVSGSLAYLARSTDGLAIADVTERRFDTAGYIGQSLELNGSGEILRAARILPTPVDAANVFIKTPLATFGASPGLWYLLSPGTSLVWRAELKWTGTGAGELSRLVTEWRYEQPAIRSIVDIEGDQGRRLRLRVNPSLHDALVEPFVTGYQVYHRVDDASLAARVRAGASRIGDRTFVVGGGESEGLAGPFPPGVWEVVAFVAAVQADEYVVPVSTDGDSTSGGNTWSTYLVTAHTADPLTWFMSLPDSGYSIDNLAPNVPAGFAAAYQAGVGYQLSWNASSDADFRFFKVYRSNVPGFTPGPANLVHSTIDVSWTDTNLGVPAYYALTAVDFAGNESAPASGAAVVGIAGTSTPAGFALRPAAPNPFRGVTTIAYDVPASGGRVFLGIYDVSGRLLRTLADGPAIAGGRSVEWDGSDRSGRALPPGLYLCRMRAPGFARTEKLFLTR